MKNQILKYSCFVVVVLFSVLAIGQQKYITHPVKEGETLYSIAKRYRVTPYAILQQNKEIKNSEEIKPNTILVIPVGGVVVKEEPQDEVAEEQIEPIGFQRHRVRKKETLFSLTQKYEVTEEQIKRYNTDLYSEQLKKGMVLQIPKYPEVLVEEEKDIEFEMYNVQPKETRWSIANKYGITIDSLLFFNPDLPKNTSYLAVGQELKLPRPKGDSLDEQKVVLYESYTVPKAIGIFRISQNYGIPVDSVIKLNPEINEIGGLKEGMVLRLPKQKPQNEVVNTENYIFYQVRPKQNIFRLTQNLKISRDSLFALNPELENGLKAGMVLKLPKNKIEVLEVKNSLVLDKINLVDSINIENRPKVVFLLPFRLDRIDFKDSERTEAQIKRLSGVKYAAGLYTGALVALDSIKKLGLSVDVEVYDTERNLETLKMTLSQNSLMGADAVLGPIDPGLLGEVAVQASNYNIPVIAPFAAKSDLSLSNVFFTVPDDETMRQRILSYVQKKRTNENLIIIADGKHQSAKDSILSIFPMARVAKMSEDGSLHLVDFQTMLSEQEENWVFVETNKPNLITSVSSILNASIGPVEEGGDIKVRMFTTDYNSAFEGESVSRPHLSNLQFMFPSSYREQDNDSFVKDYKRKFGYAPDRFAVRGFDLTYDLLLKLAHKKNLFETERIIGRTEYSGYGFDYNNNWTSGFYNQASYLMQYDELRIKQIDTK
ncbi:PBP1 and LysM peptidoglycan-binding domain-containing protein [Croceitalea rosinachiae]|uniref:LysM peptidoglycan-binding domain-containing protein n=1 Tax=Croceitalea rosinachiae TaxID=3075596 RepID=A0ABU3AEG3_9FLAO|nr:LysM peptidoglycan-binding domain-containing protein [Croceitalea sp. F388]MDT0608569.1 LysM peptidoglycan-binding domain-containing protein [Croceitalea sp. F388]